jgi:hypothetical protein
LASAGADRAFIGPLAMLGRPKAAPLCARQIVHSTGHDRRVPSEEHDMPESESQEIGRGDVRRGAGGGGGEVLVRIAAVSVILVGVLGVADASWAGPLMGC